MGAYIHWSALSSPVEEDDYWSGLTTMSKYIIQSFGGAMPLFLVYYNSKFWWCYATLFGLFCIFFSSTEYEAGYHRDRDVVDA